MTYHRPGAFRGGGVPVTAEAATPDVISAGHDFLELHQSSPEGMTASFKEKRCKTNGHTYDLVGSSRSSTLPTLHLTRRDLQSETLKKRCEICREGARCKKLGKCDLCTQICERYEAAMKVLDVQERDTVGIASRFGAGPGLSEQEDRYYTVGAFAPGPAFDFLTRLLGLHSKNTIERFIVLAKAKANGSKGEPSHPVVIDTAHIFSVNEGRPKELDFEVHDVAEQAKGNIDSLTSKLNSELDKAMDAKRTTQRDPYLTPDEIDRVIEETVGQGKKPPPPVVGMSSGNGDGPKSADEVGTSQEMEEKLEEPITKVSSEAVEKLEKPSPIVGMSSRNGDESMVKIDEDEAMPKKDDEAASSEESETPSPIVGISSRNDDEPTAENVDEPLSLQEEKNSSISSKNNLDEPVPKNEDAPLEDVTTISFSSPSPATEDAYTEHEVKDQDAQKGVEPQGTTQSEESAESEENQGIDEIQNQNRPKFSSPRMNDEYQPPRNFEPPQPYNSEVQIAPQESPLPHSENQYDPPKPSYGYQYSPEAHGPKPIPPTQEPEDNSNRVYIPEGVVTDVDSNHDLVANSKSDSGKNTFDEQYEDLKDWAKENVASAPAYQNPRNPEGLLHKVNDIIDGAASSAKTLNEKIAKLVKTKAGELAPAAREQIVKLSNMRDFVTSFSPDQQRQIMDKEEVETKPRIVGDPYDKHPRIESRYQNGKWTSEKLPPNIPPYPTRHQGGRTSEIVESQPEMTNGNTNRVPFIDPKLLNMQSIVSDLKRVPDYVIQRAGDVADALRPKMDSAQETKDPPGVMLSSRSNSDETEEGVACSHEDSGEDYREAAKEEEASASLGETREAPENESGPEEERAPGEEVKGKDGGQNETVACSKEKDEDDYELIHVKPIKGYGDGYRSSLKHHELPKFHLPTIDEVIHPKAKSSKSDGAESETEKMIEEMNRMHQHGHAAHPVEDQPTQNEFGLNPPPYPPNFPPPMDERLPPPPPPPQWQLNAEDENDEVIGSPLLENRFRQQGGAENFTNHLGKLVPAAESHPSPMHNRDVSDQMKPVYFLGDGIKLPLHMKQHGDGSLHLSVDVKKLCKCKHCNKDKTLIDAEHPRQGEGEDLGSIREDGVALMMPTPSDDGENLLEQPKPQLFSSEEHDKTEITKRSPTERKRGGGELVAVFGKDASNEIFDDVTPIKQYSANTRSHAYNVVKRKVGLVTDVLDWMKKVALDEAKHHDAIPKIQ